MQSDDNDIRPKAARIVRFVAANDLYPGHVCEFDQIKNILKINRDLYETLNERQRTQVWRAKDTIAIEKNKKQ